MNENFSPAVSVVIPMYNAEKYLPVCLESILIQTLTNFELLIVNDGSTDSSCAIAENYLEKFGGRLKIISLSENTGNPSIPRNVGLEHAQGKYVYFMDADDLIVDNALATLYEFAENYRADVVGMGKGFRCDERISPENIRLRNWIPPKYMSDKPVLEIEDFEERLKIFYKSEF